RCGRAADAPAEREMGVRRRLAFKRAEDELVAVEQIDADPGVVAHPRLEQVDSAGHGARRVGLVVHSLPDVLEHVLVEVHRESFSSNTISTSPPSAGMNCSAVDSACSRPN